MVTPSLKRKQDRERERDKKRRQRADDAGDQQPSSSSQQPVVSNYKALQRKRDLKAKKDARLDVEFKANERKRDLKAKKDARLDVEFKANERKRDLKAKKDARLDVEFKANERKRDLKAKKDARLDVEFKANERKRDLKAKKDARSNVGFKLNERKRNLKAMKIIRSNVGYKANERQRNLKVMKVIRSNVGYKTNERQRNLKAMKVARSNVGYKVNERKRDLKAKNVARSNIGFKQNELKRQRERRVANAVEEYLKLSKEGPTWICSCCGGLWFRSSITKYKFSDLRKKELNDKFILKIAIHRPTEGDEIFLCGTCNRDALHKKLPKLALSRGFEFPSLPAELQDLTELEERLVAARLPFMSIMKLGRDQQYQLRGNVVNVPINVSTSVEVLPRNFNDTMTIQLKLKKKMQYKSSYLFETIRPAKVIAAARYLVNQPLYRSEGIVISDSWLSTHDFETEVFVANEKDLDFVASEMNANDESNKCASEMEHAKIPEVQDAIDDENDDDPVNVTDTLLNENLSEENVGIEFAPGEGSRPISILFDEHCEELAFPSIYAGMKRNVPKDTSYTDIAKSELRRYDRRCAAKIPKLFFAFKKQQILRLHQAISVALRKTSGFGKITVNEALNKEFMNSLISRDDGYRILRHDRSSPAFWELKKHEAMAMLRQLGKPTFFMTLSSAETRWPELLVVLEKNVHNRVISEEEALNLTFDEKARLIRSDPVTCARYFDYRTRQLLKLIFSDAGPFSYYPVRDEYVRTEFQQRGSAHLHFLVWCQGAPQYDEGNEESREACARFVDEFCSCSKLDLPEESKFLIDLQTHKHSFSCAKQTKDGKICRFGFPLFPMPATQILEPLIEKDEKKQEELAKNFALIKCVIVDLAKKPVDELEALSFEEFLSDRLKLDEIQYIAAIRASLQRPKVFLKRSLTALKVNSFNPLILDWHRANMDIQFVLDPYACVQYIINYINKSNRGMSKLMRDTIADLDKGNYDVVQRLKIIGSKFLNATEISAQEATYDLLGIPVSRCSRASIYINTALPHERVKILKTRAMLEDLDKESTEIVHEGLLDHYEQRPRELRVICLAKFAALYEFTKTKPSSKQSKRTSSAKLFDKEQNDDDSNVDDSATDASDEDSVVEPADQEKKKERLILVDANVSDYDSDAEFKVKVKCCSNDHATFKRRKRAKVIRYRRYSIDQDRYNFFREQVMLFLPYRNEKQDILDKNVEELYNEYATLIAANRKAFVADSIDEIDKAIEVCNEQALCEESAEKTNENEAVNDEFSAFDLEQEIVECSGSSDAVAERPDPNLNDEVQPKSLEFFHLPKQLTSDDYCELIAKLNDRQRRYLMHAMHRIKKREVFYELVIGYAGVGKSTLIQSLYQSVLQFHRSLPGNNPDDIVILLLAPTGKAAFNIKGMTAHGALSIPVKRFRNESMPELSADVSNKLATRLANLEVVVIDELSMMGTSLFHQIDKRMRQIKRDSRPFGNVTVLLLGDFGQLEPVLDRYVFQNDKSSAYGSLSCNSLWQLFAVYELLEIMRQKEDKRFAEALTRFANAEETAEDVELFRSRCLSNLDPSALSANAIRLLHSNDEVNAENKRRLELLDGESCTSIAIDSCRGDCTDEIKQRLLNQAKNASTRECERLPSSLFLKIGARYMISNNIAVDDGLVNGTTGYLRMIDYGRSRDDERIPLRVWLELDSLDCGEKARQRKAMIIRLRNIDSSWTPLEREIRNLQVGRNAKIIVLRKQFSLIEAEALTFYKSQGSTYRGHGAVVKFKKGARRTMMYTAMGRVTKLEELFIDGEFNPPKDKRKSVAQMEMLRLKQENPVKLSLTFIQDLPATSLKLVFQNVQSLPKHFPFIQCDPFYSAADLLMFVETWTVADDQIDLPGFRCIGRQDCTNERKPFGSLALANERLSESVERVFCIQEMESESQIIIIYGLVLLFDGLTVILLHKLPRAGFDKLAGFLNAIFEPFTEKQLQSVVVIGDFNINLRLNDELSLSNQSNANLLTNFMREKSLSLAVDRVNNSSTNQNTLIDLCYTNIDVNVGYYENLFGYHKAIWLEIPNGY